MSVFVLTSRCPEKGKRKKSTHRQQRHASSHDRFRQRNIRDREGSPGGCDGQGLRGMGAVVRDDPQEHLRLGAPPLLEVGPQRPVDQPRHERLAVVGPAVALEERARGSARGREALGVVDLQRNERAVALLRGRRASGARRRRGGAGGRQNDSLPVGEGYGAVGLARDLSRLDLDLEWSGVEGESSFQKGQRERETEEVELRKRSSSSKAKRIGEPPASKRAWKEKTKF